MGATRVAKRKRMPAGRRVRAPADARVMVSGDERRRLINDIAYFHAEHFRQVEGQGFREEDRREAEVEIAAVLRRRRRR